MRATIFLFTFLLAQTPGWAQDFTLTGKVVSENFDPVAGIVVRLSRDGTMIGVTTFSDDLGRFRFDNLPKGNYDVVVELSFFEQVRQKVEVRGFGPDVTLTVPTPRKKHPASTAYRSGTVDVSELGENISSKALSKYADAVKAKEKGSTERAAKLFEEAIRLAPHFYKAHNELGLIYHGSGKPTDAENHYVRARELNPRAPEPLINLGILCIQRHELDNAILLLEQAARMSPPHPKAFLNLGIAHYKVGRYNDAEKALLRAQRLDGNIPEVRLMLANVYLRTGAYDQALAQIDGYLEENPNGENRASAEEVRARLLAARAGAAR